MFFLLQSSAKKLIALLRKRSVNGGPAEAWSAPPPGSTSLSPPRRGPPRVSRPRPAAASPPRGGERAFSRFFSADELQEAIEKKATSLCIYDSEFRSLLTTSNPKEEDDLHCSFQRGVLLTACFLSLLFRPLNLGATCVYQKSRLLRPTGPEFLQRTLWLAAVRRWGTLA